MGHIGYELLLPLNIIVELDTHCIEAAGKLGYFVGTLYFNRCEIPVGVVVGGRSQLIDGLCES